MIFSQKTKIYKTPLFVFCMVVLSVFNFGISVNGQTNKEEISAFFTKTNDSIIAGNLCFNILKIVNEGAKPVKARLSFSSPENWKIISMTSDSLQIEPNDTIFIPVHISPSVNATGGISYIISALLKTDNSVISASSNISVKAQGKWEFSVLKNKLFFTETNPNTTIQIKLSNKGNTNELIKLDYKVGKLLSFRQDNENFSEYINLPAFKDTVIYQTVSYRRKISATEQFRYQNNWRESSIILTASSDDDLKSTALQMRKLNSSFENTRNQSSSPLNVDYQIYNLLSSQPIRNNIRTYGSILFKKNRELQYNMGVQSVYFGSSEEKFDFTRQFLYNMRYMSKHNDIQLGYNVSNNSLHTLNGRGITGLYRLSGNTTINYAVIQNPFSNIFGQSAGAGFNIGPLSLNAEVVNENELNNNYKATSAGAGIGVNLFKSHTINLQLLGSKVGMPAQSGRDTSVLGLSYRFTYNVRYKNFNLRLNHSSAANNYILNSGLQQTNLDTRLRLNNKIYFTLYGNRQLYTSTRYPYNFYNLTNNNITDNARLSMSYYTGNVIFQVGPNYNSSIRNIISGTYLSEYQTYQPGVWTSATIKINGYRSISPNLTISNIWFRFNTTDPGLTNYNLDKNLTYSVGLNYYDPNWRVYAYYTSGSTSDLYRSIQIDDKPTLSSSIQFRPYYENYFFNRKLKLSAYINYTYYMPSGRENIMYNVRYDHFLKNGWNLNVSAFMFTNVRVVDEGRVSTKDMNLMVGVTKAFNIQQPRQKYHDIKLRFFNDLDGNRIKTDNEPPVSDIVVGVEKDVLSRNEASAIPEIRLISDLDGQVSIDNLPRDKYKFSFSPVNNLEYLYFLDGTEQLIENTKNRVINVPLAESFKIRGKIIVHRDPNSTEGKLDMSGVRVTAKAANGENYSVLTDNFGSFVISVPNADKYSVKVNNVFGEYFRIDNDEIQVQFSNNKTVNVDFIFVEQKRQIQFDNGNQFYNFNSIGNQ